MTEPTELLPCPFCGGAPTTIERPDNIDGTQFFYAFACYCGGYSACAHKMAVRKTPEFAKADAIAAWNRRASTPQPTQAQAGAVPLTDEQLLLLRLANSSLFHLFERWNKKEIPHYQLMDEMGQVIEHVIRRTVAAHGIKGGQHGTE